MGGQDEKDQLMDEVVERDVLLGQWIAECTIRLISFSSLTVRGLPLSETSPDRRTTSFEQHCRKRTR